MRGRALRGIGLIACAALALGGCQSWLRRAKPAPPPPPAVAPPEPPLIIFQPRQPPPPPPAAPVVRNCVPKTLSPPPRYPDTDQALRAAGGAADRYQMMAAGRLLREQRLDELEKVVAGCK